MINVHSYAVARHLLGGKNLVLLAMRQVVLGRAFSHIFVTRTIANNRAFYSTRGKAYMFPLWLSNVDGELQVAQEGGEVNLNKGAVLELWSSDRATSAGPRPEEVVSVVYALAHSPTYRQRFDAPLRMDYPRLPVVSSAELLREPIRLGGELVALHLVEAPAQHALTARYDKSMASWRYSVSDGQRLPIALSFTGTEHPVIEKVAWSDNTVWIDAAKPKKSGADDARVTGSVGFQGVPEAVWNFQVGGYKVCEKWLKDRKGRTLTAHDVGHYHRVVVALFETMRIMGEIDEIIDAHGGWPAAFGRS